MKPAILFWVAHAIVDLIVAGGVLILLGLSAIACLVVNDLRRRRPRR